MIGFSDNLTLAVDSIRAHKLRAALTVLGLTMGVATLILVMTLVQWANLYVEQKIANLGTNVFPHRAPSVCGHGFHAAHARPAQQIPVPR
jgi:aryl carrier-like protein